MCGRNKQELRTDMKNKRRKLAKEDRIIWDQAVCNFLERDLADWIQAGKRVPAVYAYVSLPDEVGTKPILELLWRQQIPVSVPKVSGQEMDFYQIRSFSDLEKGCMGILEPVKGLPKSRETGALVLVPGLAFDHAGFRLGYGGGYYDRFLKAETRHQTIGLAYEIQLVEAVPHEEWDQPLDRILAPSGWITCNRRRNE